MTERPRRRLVAGIAISALALAIAGVGVTIARHHNGSTSRPSSSAAVTSDPLGLTAADGVAVGYYLAVARTDAGAAYALLCTRQQVGLSEYAAELAENTKTGTKVTTFRRTGVGRVQGQQAAVPAQVVLADGQRTPIIVLLVAQAGRWRVCSSNLGGVLPPPGIAPGTSAPPSPGTSI